MWQLKILLKKISKDQFVIHNLYGDDEFALTESTPLDRKGFERNKTLTIDFGDNITRYIDLDVLLIVLKEFYGKDFLIDSLNQIKFYDEVKDKIIKK